MTSRRLLRHGLAIFPILSALAAAAGCKSSPQAPTGFGVNIVVDAHALSDAARKNVSVGSLEVSGAETDIQPLSITATPIESGELRFRYIPKVTSGDLTFELQVMDAANRVYGSGTSKSVAIDPNNAVTATITLAAADGTQGGDGAKCTTNGQCASGICADDVCCHDDCSGDCRSCAVKGHEGLCTMFEAGTDPKSQCLGFSGATGGAGGKGGAGGAGGKAGATGTADAGSADAGEAINPPDGGIKAMANECGGTCNGSGKCDYAPKGTSCGTAFCNSHRDLADIACDGQGTCGISLSACANGFGCELTSSPGMCRTTCTADIECQSGFYCANGACVAQKTVGKTCTGDGECGSGHCASGVCCKTACASPNSCDSSGVCKCQNLTCNAGVSCALFYPDVDVDGFGDKNGTPKPGCADTPPAGYVADNTDCDDHDAYVFPGQTAYFTTISKGVGTFDYNCDGIQEKGLPEYPGATCTFCPSACSAGCTAASASTCASANAQASLACPREGGICPILLNPQPVQTASEIALPLSSASASASVIVLQLACCGCNDHAGLNAAVGCGQNGNYVTCGTCAAANGAAGTGTATSTVTKTQSCH